MSLSGGQTFLLDADGSALVIHAKADDQKTDPAGDSGERVACGVIKTSATAQKGTPASGSSGALPLMLGTGLAVVLLVGMFATENLKPVRSPCGYARVYACACDVPVLYAAGFFWTL